MARRNLTLQLDEDVIRRAKVVAAKRGTSVSGLVTRQLEEIVQRDTRYEEARQMALAALARSVHRGGRQWTREDLHDQ
jgi:hypothetical protein